MPCLPEFFSAQGIFCTLLPAQPPILFLPSWVRSAGTGVLQVLSLGSYKIHGKSRSQLQKMGVFMWSLWHLINIPLHRCICLQACLISLIKYVDRISVGGPEVSSGCSSSHVYHVYNGPQPSPTPPTSIVWFIMIRGWSSSAFISDT